VREWPGAAVVIFKFGHFELDTGKRELRCDSGVRAVEPQVFNLLALLIRNRDRIVTRDELFDAVWQRRIVSDSVLGSRINAARQAVDDDGKRQNVIRTLRKSGVRFIAAVTEESHESGAPSAAARVHRAAFDLAGAPSLVVLPFAWVDASDRSRSVAVDFGEELRHSLHGADWLRVIAMAWGPGSNGARAMKDVAPYALEGSVRTDADLSTVIARLTDTRTGVCLWSERQVCSVHDASMNVSRVAANVGRAVSDQIFAVERVRARSIPLSQKSAWDAIAVALSLINTRKKDRVRRAEALLAAVARSDVRSPAVFSLLAFCATLGVHLGWTPRRSRQQFALGYVERALAVDERDPWAYLALGYSRLYMDNRPDEAIAILQHALNIDPGLSMGHYLTALSLSHIGETDAAFKEAALAERLSTFDLLAKGNAGAHDNVRATACFIAGRYQEGLVFARRAVSASPLGVPAHRQVMTNAAFAGDIKLAAGAMAKVKSISPDLRRWLAESEPIWGRSDDYRRYVEAFRIAGLRAS
jgi:DNA-binding winged helix-turn-helix (wHTH) protein/tetratricopeptide (TPR) repeat protein